MASSIVSLKLCVVKIIISNVRLYTWKGWNYYWTAINMVTGHVIGKLNGPCWACTYTLPTTGRTYQQLHLRSILRVGLYFIFEVNGLPTNKASSTMLGMNVWWPWATTCSDTRCIGLKKVSISDKLLEINGWTQIYLDYWLLFYFFNFLI